MLGPEADRVAGLARDPILKWAHAGDGDIFGGSSGSPPHGGKFENHARRRDLGRQYPGVAVEATGREPSDAPAAATAAYGYI